MGIQANRPFVAIVATALMVFCAGSLSAFEHVVPTNNTHLTGNHIAAFPMLSAQCRRFQQVYNASLFSGVQHPQSITGISFRFRTSSGSNIISGAQIDMRLSTTSKMPDGLSSNFDENVGSDEQVVVSHPVYQLINLGGLGKFAFEFPFDQPFHYDPAEGNLLLDIRTPGYFYAPGYMLDALNVGGDGLGRMYAPDPLASTGTVDTVGAITRFSFQDVEMVPLVVGDTPGEMTVRWTSVSNGVYAVDYSTNLVAGFMPFATNITATAPTSAYTDVFPSNEHGHFRVRRRQ